MGETLNKKSQAEIITTILIILLVLAAIVIIWAVIQNVVKKSSGDVELTQFTNRVEIQSVGLFIDDSGVKVFAKKIGKEDLTEIKFIFYNDSGENKIISKTNNLPSEFEIKSYDFSFSEIEIADANKVSVIPVFGKDIGMESSKENIEKNKETKYYAPPYLVSWWKFDESSGTIASDSADSNPATVYNPATFVSGKIGNALKFNGQGGCYASLLTVPANLDLGNEITISAWINTISTELDGIVKRGLDSTSTNNQEYALVIFGGKSGMLFSNGNLDTSDDNAIYGTQIINDNQWHHIVGVLRNNDEVEIWVDGVLDATGTKTVSGDLDSNQFIGALKSTTSGFFNGSIDDAMIFNKSLSEEEIKAVYNNLEYVQTGYGS